MSHPIRVVGAQSPTERLCLSRSHDSVTNYVVNLYHVDVRKTDAKRSTPRKVEQFHEMDASVATGFWDAYPTDRLPKSRKVATNRRLPFRGSAYL